MGKDATVSPFDALAAVATEEPGQVVERALGAAREVLGMDVSYLAELDDTHQLFRALDGDVAAFALRAGESIRREESYCDRLVSGEIGNVVRDARMHPVLRDLELTQRAGIGAYVGVPLTLSDGSVRGTLCCLSKASDPDVAERDVRFMEVLARLVADELERVELRTETDRLKDDLLALTSHELRTPLTNIGGYLEMLRDDEAEGLTDDGRDFLDAATRNVDRLQRLVAQLLFVARAQADRVPFEPVELDLADVAREGAEGCGDRVRFDVEAGVVVRADRDMLVRVVTNLVSNAVKYSPDGGEVQVLVAHAGDRALLRVRDHGIGIPADEVDGLFERFRRASNAHRAGLPGVGLGLWIVQDVVTRHGGEIDVRSRTEGPDRGTTISVTLPLAAP